MKLLTFPKNFAWGTSSSAVMVEENTPGCPRGETIWDRQFRAASGESLTTPSEGAGHIARFRDDIRLLKRLGIPHYNFSLSWSRIFPGGTGQVSSGGLDFYQKLVDELCRHSITPWITLYGNDMPQPLQDRGGWLCRDTAGYFTDFAENMAAVFSDRVNRWITLSDPYTELNFGYRLGSHAPGYADPERTFIAAHNMLLGHAGGQAALKSCGKPLKAGISVSINPPKRIGFLPSRIKRIAEEFMMYLFLDPVFLGRYPVILETRIFSQNRENIQPN
ncbi:MAG: glycoside hydrolase family 1 protein, partial [Spirochaetota bacterium]